MARRSSHLLLLLGATLGLAALLLLLVIRQPAPAAGDDFGTASELATVRFPASGATVLVELAATEDQRQVGLMHRTSLPDGRGMLFVFDQTVNGPFWMKNTFIPLSIAFIDAQGVVVDIQDMQPQDETLHYPAAPYRYALEVPQGWFGRAGVQVGHQAELPPDAWRGAGQHGSDAQSQG